MPHAANRLTSLTNPLNETTGFVYDALGRLTRQNNANGTYSTWTFDAAGQVTNVATRKSNNNVILSMDYTRDNVGNRTVLTQKDPGTREVVGTTSYTYDAADKLLSAGNIAHTWDNDGNLASKTVGGVTTTFTYDEDDRLRTAHDGTTVQFTYDGDGVRRSKTVGQSASHYLSDVSARGSWPFQLLAEYDGAGEVLARYRYGESLVSQRRGNERAWPTYNALGSVQQRTSDTQSVVGRKTYDAWGEPVATDGSVDTPWWFSAAFSSYTDTVPSLVSMGVRSYEPATGRFTTPDPAFSWLQVTWRSPRQAHGYLFAFGNPARFVDPSGRLGCDPSECAHQSDAWTTPPVVHQVQTNTPCMYANPSGGYWWGHIKEKHKHWHTVVKTCRCETDAKVLCTKFQHCECKLQNFPHNEVETWCHSEGYCAPPPPPEGYDDWSEVGKEVGTFLGCGVLCHYACLALCGPEAGPLCVPMCAGICHILCDWAAGSKPGE